MAPRPNNGASTGLILEPDPPQRIKILGLQDWKYWKIGNIIRIGKKIGKKGFGDWIPRI